MRLAGGPKNDTSVVSFSRCTQCRPFATRESDFAPIGFNLGKTVHTGAIGAIFVSMEIAPAIIKFPLAEGEEVAGIMKGLGWLVKLIVTAGIASCMSVLTTYVLVNMYVQQLLQPFGLALSENKIDFSEFVVNLWSESNILRRGGTEERGNDKGAESGPGTPRTNEESVAASGAVDSTGAADASSEAPEEDAVAAWSQTGSKEQIVISAEQFQEKREKLSEEDKNAVFSLLISRLPEEELQQLSTKLEDGLTNAELVEIEKIVERYVKPEELEQLMAIVNKY